MNISIAVTIPEEVKRNLAAAIERLQPVAHETLWTERDQLQLPIVTIGEIAPAFLPHVTAAATAICAHTPAFPISVTGYGFFGSKRFPHRVWAAIDPPTVLDAMYEEIWNAMRGFGFEKPGELVQPHIVLGICKTGIKNQILVEAMDADEECEFGAWDVRKVTLYDCKTGKNGKVYRKVNQIPLIG
jgi:2'-5' RNA ligase